MITKQELIPIINWYLKQHILEKAPDKMVEFSTKLLGNFAFNLESYYAEQKESKKKEKKIILTGV